MLQMVFRSFKSKNLVRVIAKPKDPVTTIQWLRWSPKRETYVVSKTVKTNTVDELDKVLVKIKNSYKFDGVYNLESIPVED